MRSQVAFALLAFGMNSLSMQALSAAQVLAVSSNGKWDMQYDPNGHVDSLSAKAIAACKAKGGTDPKIVWSKALNYFYGTHGKGFTSNQPIRIVHGAIAISDNGNGTIVGWCFNHPYHEPGIAIKDCQKKGGQNPKVVAKF